MGIRFTPTCVGNTRNTTGYHEVLGSPPHAWGILHASTDNWHRAATVHPHMRGEYLHASTTTTGLCGSPPHAWGILDNCQSWHLTACGSPPHAWGILTKLHSLSRQACTRFTPTCVGNTLIAIFLQQSFAVHPHMRGEYADGIPISGIYGGSPPHAWGILCSLSPPVCLFGSPPHAWGIHAHGLIRRRSRFTPTCVGNTKD